jgi:glycerol kinase
MKPADMRKTMGLLTLRERDILQSFVAGKRYKEIADELGVNASTVAVHVRNAYKKLDVHSRKELVSSFEEMTAGLKKPETETAAPSSAGTVFREGGNLPLFQIAQFAARQYVLALDQGSTHSRAVVLNRSGEVISAAQKKLEQHAPQKGWVEQDGLSIWSTQAGVAAEAITSAGLRESQIAAVGIANQRETTLVWDRESGAPVYPAISWADCRTSDRCERLRREGRTAWIRAKTGLVPDAFFSATKIQWILEHVKGARRLAEAGRLLFGTVDSWLVWNFTRGEVHVTDVSNASRTLLYNIYRGEWDRELLALFGIPETMLPQVRPSSEVYAVIRTPFFADGVPIAGLIADQQAAMFGQRCATPGMVKCSCGTSCFVMMNTGPRPVLSKNALLTTVAWSVNGETAYALEGGLFMAEASLDWLREKLGLFHKTSDVERIAGTVDDSGGVYMVPAFSGLGAPYWNRHVRGTLVGLSCDSNAGHLCRAVIEGIACQAADVLKMMTSDSGLPVAGFRADGRMTGNDLFMQFLADICGMPISRSKVDESMALGAAYCAGLAVGYWSGQAEIDGLWKAECRFEPRMEDARRRRYLKGWRRALATAMFWGR